jgi:hypothetical protein
MKQINVLFLYRQCKELQLLSGFYYSYEYHFFFSALKRNPRINVTYLDVGPNFDVNSLNKKFDIILLYENRNVCEPDTIIGLNKLDTPVIAQLSDAWDALDFDHESFHDDWKINAYFNFFPTEYVHKFYPKKYKYKMITGWLEKSLFNNLKKFDLRKKDKILNSGAIARMNLKSRLIIKLFRTKYSDPLTFYKLRTMCSKLPYVDYTSTMQHEYVGDKYPKLLEQYSSAIAATTNVYSPKYFEIPAAGCMTFMESTEKNNAKTLGYIDNEKSIFINEKNYENKFNEYLGDKNNPKWKQIAENGRTHALENFNNDLGINSLIDLMEELIK